MFQIKLDESEIELTFIRSPGPGGQNVNKVATGVQLRFNVVVSASLSDALRARLLAKLANKLTQAGDIIIKATRFRTQERNKQDALERLYLMLNQAAHVPKARKKTKPTFASKQRRLTKKKLHGKAKLLRQRKSITD